MGTCASFACRVGVTCRVRVRATIKIHVRAEITGRSHKPNPCPKLCPHPRTGLLNESPKPDPDPNTETAGRA